jgi:hypothetical protein
MVVWKKEHKEEGPQEAGKDNLSKRAGHPIQKTLEEISIIPIGRRSLLKKGPFNKGRKFPRSPGDSEIEVDSAAEITDHSSYFIPATGKMRMTWKTIVKNKTKRAHKGDTLTGEKEMEENDSTDEESSLTLKSNDIKSLMRILETVMMNTAIIEEKLEASTNGDSTMEKLNAGSATQLERIKSWLKKFNHQQTANLRIRGATKRHTVAAQVIPIQGGGDCVYDWRDEGVYPNLVGGDSDDEGPNKKAESRQRKERTGS